MSSDRKFELRPADGVDPKRVPARTLHTGAEIPAIGIGTFGNDRFTPDQIADSIQGGLEVGFRFIDCAAVYANEPQVGRALAAAMAAGVPRDEMFVTSKLWNDKHRPEEVLPAIKKSLADLNLSHLDMYFIHWPFRNHHEPGAAHDARSSNSSPYDPAKYLETYRELEKAVDAGLIRHIGTSNMTMKKLDSLLAEARVKPAANQMEMHPVLAQTEFFHYLLQRDILPIAFCPMGSPGRPARDREPDDVEVLTHPVIVELARERGVHPAAICIMWAVTRGQIPIPSSIHREKYLSNLKAAVAGPLTAEEMKRMEAADCHCRLIKGQVFLWDGATSWRQLWDE